MIRGKESQKWDRKTALPSVDFCLVFPFSRSQCLSAFGGLKFVFYLLDYANSQHYIDKEVYQFLSKINANLVLYSSLQQ